jgi:hypothetical protein
MLGVFAEDFGLLHAALPEGPFRICFKPSTNCSSSRPGRLAKIFPACTGDEQPFRNGLSYNLRLSNPASVGRKGARRPPKFLSLPVSPMTVPPSPRPAVEPRTTVEAVGSVIVRSPPASSPSVANVPYLVDVRDLVRLGKSVWHCRHGTRRERNAAKSGDSDKCKFELHGIILLLGQIQKPGAG